MTIGKEGGKKVAETEADRPEGARDARDLLLAKDLSPEQAAALLSPFGFRDAARADALLQRLAGERAEERRALADLLPFLLDELARAGSPERGLRNLVRYAEAAASRRGLFFDLVRDRAALERAAILLSQSEHFADILVREPRLLFWLEEAREAPSRAELEAEARAAVTGGEDALERLKRRELLAAGMRDHVLSQPLAEIARELSTLAEALVAACLDLARRRAAARFPALAAPALPFAVVALGKLGGAELNYSSDIDLIFVHDERFETGEPDVSPREAFDRLARELLRPLGRLYRVDLRLRPEGALGALSRSIPAYVEYYERRGRTWERQALLKARPIAGDLALGERFLRAIEPFVYRPALDMVAIAEVKSLKRKIEERGARRAARDVKEGPGGIRDIEFAVQFLQLLYGGELPEVRDPSTLGALARLERARCLLPDDARAMREAYVFLRTVEHRLQTLRSLQTHEIPRDEESEQDLAARLGYRGERARERFFEDLARHSEGARQVLQRLLHDLFPEAGEKDALAAAPELILEAEPAPEKVARVLGAAGFLDPSRALFDIRRLAEEKSRFLAPSPRTKTYLASLLPRLLREIAATPDPQGTLARFEHAVATLGGKAVFYQLLSENPGTLELFVRLASDSPWLSSELARNPGLLDEVVDFLLTGARATIEAVEARIRAAGDLAAAKRAFTLLTGIRDLGGRANVANVQEELTALAEAILRALVRGATEGREPVPFLVFGLGKLGGRELGYGSDLDLVFAYEGASAEAAGRAARTVLRRAAEGALYHVDTRLRPEGSQGPLAASVEALERYYREGRAAPWERLAATKLRPVAGDLEAGAAAARRILAAVYEGPTEELSRAARDMRRRLEEAAAGPGDLKRAPGGLLDIEFATALLRLRARGEPEGLRDPGLVPALHAAARAGLIGGEAHIDLLTGAQFLRKVESRLRIYEGRAVSALPEAPAALRELSLRLGYVDTPRKRAERAFEDERRYVMGRVRARFEEIAG